MFEKKITTIFVDEHIRVIHKPENITFHSDDASQGVVRLVKEAYPQETLYPVHRLDKITSGLMVFARSSEVNTLLSKQLQDKQIEKYYLAISNYKPAKKQGAVSGDMKKGRRGSYLLLRSKLNPAVTHFFAKSFNNKGQRCWLFVLKPETGKTHQLRVAMKSLASPVLGDKRYEQQNNEDKKSPTQTDSLTSDFINKPAIDAQKRGYLHAYKMRFDLLGKRYELVDPEFTGRRFNLMEQKNDEALKTLFEPEKLKWPKRAFKLSL